jgi:hypothetical protein
VCPCRAHLTPEVDTLASALSSHPARCLLLLIALVLVLTQAGAAAPLAGAVELQLTPEQADCPRGAPVLATLRIFNPAEQTVEIDLGRNAEGNIGLKVTRPDGSSIDSRLPFESGISFPGLVTLAKGGSHRQTLVLNQWHDPFDQAGEYSITLYVGQDLESAGELHASAILRVIPDDPARLKDLCSDLEKRASQANVEVFSKADRALSFVRDEACLPYLARAFKDGVHGQPGIARALVKMGTEGAIQALVEGWDRLLAGQRAWVLRDIDEARTRALASALAQAGKRLMPEDPWN